MDSRQDVKVIAEGLGDIARIIGWSAWGGFVCWFVFEVVLLGDAILSFDQWFWSTIGDRLVQAGVPEGFILTQLTVSTMGLIPLFIIAPRFLWKCLNRPAQEPVTAQGAAPQK
jgi:hypothetical protein